MAAILNYSKLSVVDSKLHCPPLEEIKIVLKKHLEETFEVVQVDVVDCPDLTNPPFNLASQGLNGSPTIVDVGGPPYLLPLVQRDKVYSFQEIGNYCGNVKPAFIIGAGAGPWPYAKTNCEMVANLKITNNEVENKTRIVKMLDKPKAKFQVDILPNNELRYALLGNFFISQGKPGKVLKIHCEKRKGEDNYVTAIRKGLNSAYPSKPVGLGGVFLLGSGKAKQHIMQDFSETPIKNEQDLNNWLFFSEMDAPLVNVGTIVSEDPGLDLRVQHFHSFNVDGKAGGHYHYDTTPETVVYTGYFNTAPLLYRIDQPEHAHTFGHD